MWLALTMDGRFYWYLSRPPSTGAQQRLKRLGKIALDIHGKHERECPVCDRRGFFVGMGSPVRFDAQCLRCGSLERHRQHFLLIERNKHWIDGSRLLHFAPEQCFVRSYSQRCMKYVRADAAPQSDEAQMDIQKIPWASGSFDTIICHQVLEHVADDRAL